MKFALLAAGLLCLGVFDSPGEVLDSAPDGFTLKIAVDIQASPDAVYDKLVHHIGDWWEPKHTFSQDARNLSIDDKPMGCFCESLPNNGGVRHMQVILVMPGKALVLTGGLGPLESLPVTGTMRFDFATANSATKVTMTYGVAGYLSKGLQSWA